jgi:hypothetical protein
MCLPSSPNNTHTRISNRSQTQYGQDSPHSSSCFLQAAPPITFLVSILYDNFCLFKPKNLESSLYFIRHKCILGAPGLKQAKSQPFLTILQLVSFIKQTFSLTCGLGIGMQSEFPTGPEQAVLTSSETQLCPQTSPSYTPECSVTML